MKELTLSDVSLMFDADQPTDLFVLWLPLMMRSGS